MDLSRNSLTIATRAAGRLSYIVVALCCTASVALASTAHWEKSDLDVWVYNQGSGHTRAFGPTFANEFVDDGTGNLADKTLFDPARFGTTLLAFNTGAQIAAGRAPSRYVINSVTVNATITYESDPPSLTYYTQPISHTEIRDEVISGQMTGNRPMELYGAGMRFGYTGYEFTGASAPPGPPLIDERVSLFTSASGYKVFPVIGSETQPGTYVDVMNSVTGGYSETAPLHETGPFTPTPWAIGTTPDVDGANIVQDFATFTFNVDLNAAGVRDYVQESLAAGAVGFILSTLHSTVQEGAGGGYPRWVLKEAGGTLYNYPLERMPKLTVDYTVIPPVPGDYDDNGTVDATDYVLWRQGGPLANQVNDPSQVNYQDYIEWRARYGNTPSGSGPGAGRGVPEPEGVSLGLTALLLLGCTNFGRSCR
jgi:hypothetical protein